MKTSTSTALKSLTLGATLQFALSGCGVQLNGTHLSDSSRMLSQQLRLLPSDLQTTTNVTSALTVQGGTPPYQFDLLQGPGVVDTNAAVYQSPNDLLSGDVASVRVTDALGVSAVAQIQIFDTLAISDASVLLNVGDAFDFTAVGGVPPYAYSLLSGSGSIVSDNSGGHFTAPGSPGTTVVRVVDSAGHEDTSVVTVVLPLTSDVDGVTAVGSTLPIAPADGAAPYSFSILSGTGSLSAASGSSSVYTPVNPGTVSVRVTDFYGRVQNRDIVVHPALQISPSTVYVRTSETFTFGSTGGVPRTPVPAIAFDLVSGGGLASITASGVLTAGSTPGTVVVRGRDDPSSGQSSTASVQIHEPLQFTSTHWDVQIGSTTTLTTTGGIGPFTFAVTSGVGSIVAGDYDAGAVAGTATVSATDTTTGEVATATVRVYDTLWAGSGALTLAFGNSHTFNPTGGIAPYAFALGAGTGGGALSGTTSSSTTFTAAAPAGTREVVITDGSGQSQTVVITVNPSLSATPASSALAVGNSTLITPAGGVPPYSYSVVGGATNGSMTGATYTAPSTPGTYTVRVSDGHTPANTTDVTLTVNAALSLSPGSASIGYNDAVDLTAAGGVPPYVSWTTTPASLPSGAGFSTISATTRRLTSGLGAGTVTVQVTDSLGNTATSNVAIATPPALAVSPTSITLVVGDSEIIAPTAGAPAYGFAVQSGNSGSLSGSGGTRVFTASAPANTSTVVRVSDAGFSSPVDVTFHVKNPIQLSAAATEIAVNNTLNLTVTDGVPPYSFIIAPSGAGSITGNLYTAPSNAQTVTIVARDSRGHDSAPWTVNVRPRLSITPVSASMMGGETQEFRASGGIPPYSFSITTLSGGGGTISPSGLLPLGQSATTFTGSVSAGTARITVVDSVGNVASTASITVGRQPPTSAPTISSLDQITFSSFRMNWSSVTNSDGYSVRINGGAWIDAGAVNTYTFSGVAANTVHSVAVRAYNAGGIGPISTTATQTICGLDRYLAGTCQNCSTGTYSAGGIPASCTACSDSIANSVAFTYGGTGGGVNACPLSSLTCAGGYAPSAPAKTCSACSAGYYTNGSSACAACAAGSYSPSSASSSCTTCATGTFQSATGQSSCPPCTNPTTGFYWTGTGSTSSSCPLSACTTKPANSAYTGHGGTTNNCPWTCNTGSTGPTCTSCLGGYYWNGSTCLPQVCTPSSTQNDSVACSSHGTRTRTCAADGSAWGSWGSCACDAGYTGASCASCASGYYFNGSACVPQVCTPSTTQNDSVGCSLHGTRSRTCAVDGSAWGSWGSCSCDTGYTGASCASCASGYYFNGSACVPQVCTPSSTQNDSVGCSSHGTRSRTCAADGSAWGSWGACTCSTGYTGATCASCASGYYFNGTACVPQVCTPSSTQNDSVACSSHGTRSRTCAADGSTWGSWGSCACDTGYTGSTCASCASGYYFNGTACVPQVCTPSSTQNDSVGCSSHGTRSRTCSADGSAWGTWDSCTCDTGYTGASCSSCASGYFFNGTACVPQVCTPSATQNDSVGCSSHGTRSRTCAGDGSAWSAWSSCSCTTGYAGATCGSCAAGYTFDGFACTSQLCSPFSVENETTGCSNHGTRSRTCSVDGSFWGGWGVCNCDPGYVGATCSSCDFGYNWNGSACVFGGTCLAGTVEPDFSGCSYHGQRERVCGASGSWGSWSACTCSYGYGGPTCSTCANGYHWDGASCVP